jgi:putative endonuclease
MDAKELGRRGEAAAQAYLQRVGLAIADTNWRGRAGELDIVAWDGPCLVICEVKTRRSVVAGTPEEAVTDAKRRRLTRLARAWLAASGLEPDEIRFDVVTVSVISEDRALLRHHRRAFEPSC